MGEVTRIEWPVKSPVALFPAETARTLLRLGYARSIAAAQMEEYNALVDAWNAANPDSATPAPSAPAKAAPVNQAAPVDNAPPPAPPRDAGAEIAFPPDGWTAHPSAPGFYYRGAEVKNEAELRAMAKGDAATPAA